MDTIPLLPRDIVVYPGQTVTVRLTSDVEEAIVQEAFEDDALLGLVLAEPTEDGMALALTPDAIGTAARVLVHEPSGPRGRGQVLLQAERRFRAMRVAAHTPFPRLDVLWLPEPVGDVRQAHELEAAVRAFFDPDPGPAHAPGIGEITFPEPGPFDDAEGPVEASFAAAAAVTATVSVKQRLLAASSASERLGLAHAILRLQDQESTGALSA